MNAGRELDALVAEKVMGWAFWSAEHDWDGPDDVTFFALADDALAVYEPGDEEPAYYWAPSDAIASAWRVMEKLRGRGDVISLNWYPDAAAWECVVHRLPVAHGESSSAPLAICLAALKAVGVEVPA